MNEYYRKIFLYLKMKNSPILFGVRYKGAIVGSSGGDRVKMHCSGRWEFGALIAKYIMWFYFFILL